MKVESPKSRRKLRRASRNVRIEIPEADFSTFLVYLGIGVLSTIRNRTVPSEVGIWTLGRLALWRDLRKVRIPEQVIDVINVADELSAIEELLPDRFDETIAEQIAQLEEQLKATKDPIWQISCAIVPSTEESEQSAQHPQKKPGSKTRKPDVQIGGQIRGK
ncbi:MAG: hypothetical protein EYC68_14950 [Chloroflexota bacterium]|nr:MAG: hypothetical protein EYC68_14950 [Chloroflexota bacterium]